MEISQNFVAFSEYMNFKWEFYSWTRENFTLIFINRIGTRAIITSGMYIYFKPTFLSPNFLFNGFFFSFWRYVKLVFMSSLYSRAGYYGVHTVLCSIRDVEAFWYKTEIRIIYFERLFDCMVYPDPKFLISLLCHLNTFRLY